MKKIFSAVLFALIFMGVTMNANAMPKEKVSIDVYYGTPTLDGKISEGEWDKENAVILNKDTAVAWMGTVSDDVTYYYSWDDEALYIAVDAVDNDVILPANIHEVFTKDAVQFALDPAGLIGKANGSGGMFFSAGMLKDGSLGAVYHPYGGSAQQFKYTGAAQRTTKGFSFEIEIPWKDSIEILAKDGFRWTHGDGQKINFILAMLDRDNNGATSNCYMTAVATNPKADFTPVNYAIQ